MYFFEIFTIKYVIYKICKIPLNIKEFIRYNKNPFGFFISIMKHRRSSQNTIRLLKGTKCLNRRQYFAHFKAKLKSTNYSDNFVTHFTLMGISY